MSLLLALILAVPAPLAAAQKHLQAGQLDELVFDLADGVKLEPADLPEAARLLGQGAARADQQGDAMLAMQLAQTAHRRDPKQLDALRVLTVGALRDQAFTDADAYADTLGALAPNDAHLTLLRARVAAAEEDWEHAAALSGPLARSPALTAAEKREAQQIQARAAPLAAQRQPAPAAPSDAEAQLHLAAQLAAQDRAAAFDGREPNAGSRSGSGAIVVYGTSWCGFCKKARQYFKGQHLAFEDKDVERDPAAAEEMRGKLASAGLQGSGVPVIDVRGTIIRGFDRRAIDHALHRGED